MYPLPLVATTTTTTKNDRDSFKRPREQAAQHTGRNHAAPVPYGRCVVAVRTALLSSSTISSGRCRTRGFSTGVNISLRKVSMSCHLSPPPSVDL